jgi:cytochrome c oxidase assembly protein subunit 15
MNRALNRFAAFTTGCTFLLLIAGALVTGNDAADSVPDWPLAYHRIIPPLVGGIRFEFGHRVVAGLVAILTVILAVWIARREPRRWVRNVGWIALALVVAQALLGALRVLKGDPAVTATAHATLAQLFFVSLICLTVFTGRWWQSDHPVLHDAGSPSLRALALATSVIIVIQTILGAGYRHGAFGIWPHLVGAAAVTAAVIMVGRTVRIRFGEVKPLRRAVIFLHAFFGLQIILGGAAWGAVQAQQRAPQPLPLLVGITVAHVLGAALLLAASVVLTSRCYRLIPVGGAINEPSSPSKHPAGAAV